MFFSLYSLSYFPFSSKQPYCFPSSLILKHSMTFGSVVIVGISPWLQLYGEYREQLGNFARREAARLLTERQWRRQAGDTTAAGRKGHGRRHHHHHPMTLESHHSHVSSTKKPRPYSKCQGDTLIERHTQSCALARCKLQNTLKKGKNATHYPAYSATP